MGAMRTMIRTMATLTIAATLVAMLAGCTSGSGGSGDRPEPTYAPTMTEYQERADTCDRWLTNILEAKADAMIGPYDWIPDDEDDRYRGDEWPSIAVFNPIHGSYDVYCEGATPARCAKGGSDYPCSYSYKR